MALPNKFGIRLHESGWTGEIAVATGIYQHAAAAVPAILGIRLPVDMEIWSMVPSIQDKRFNFRVADNEFGQLVVKTLVRALEQKTTPTIDDVPSCGSENDYRRAHEQTAPTRS